MTHSDESVSRCTCDVRGPNSEDTTFDEACPFHGQDGSMVATWAIRRRNGGVDINEAMADDPSLFGSSYGQWVPVVRTAEVERLRSALRTIRGPEDRGPWIEVYREAGGGYEGLQAIAREALEGQ